MSGYYIDGYNLLFRFLRSGENLKHERTLLVQELEKKLNFLEMEASLVFDSHYQPDEGSIAHIKKLEIIFTGTGETADDYILKKVKESSDPSKIHVVTSDKKLAMLCKRRLAKVQTVEEFTQMLDRRYRNKLQGKRKPIEGKGSSLAEIQQKKTAEPAKKEVLIEDCNRYYLEIFQKQFSESLQIPPAKPHSQKTKKLKKSSLSKEDQLLFDMERWQRAFERSVNPDEESY